MKKTACDRCKKLVSRKRTYEIACYVTLISCYCERSLGAALDGNLTACHCKLQKKRTTESSLLLVSQNQTPNYNQLAQYCYNSNWQLCA